MAVGTRMSFVVVFGLALAAQGTKVTPMEKVITLLKDLSAKVVAEGKQDAAEYDKYACFCKEQASDKLYAIEKSTARIADLSAQIEKLESDIAELNLNIQALSKQITNLENEIEKKTQKRAEEHEVYLAKAKDMSEAIDACQAAIDALKDSKQDVKEGGGKTSLMQVTDRLAKAVEKQPALSKAASKVTKVTKLLSVSATKGAPKFQYQSNDIIATLEDLLATFKKMKKDLDFEEHDINAAFEKNKLALSNEKKFAEKDKAQKEAIVEAKTEELNAAKTDRDEEQADKNADQAFLDVLTNECQEKANLFDRRSKTRADEIKALTEATAELEKGAVPNFSANKKLVGLQKAAAPQKTVKTAGGTVSFVQIENVQHRHDQIQKKATIEKLHKFLSNAADRTGSKLLATMAVRVNLAEDHFVKVRQLINDLIAKLEADAAAEADQKSFCDKGMAEAIQKRDNANSKIEDADAQITTLTANKNALESEIKLLNSQIAELKKALLEATELRAAEKAENVKTMGMTEEGAQAVKTALEILQQFYENAFVQKGKYVPPDSDREGNTVGDLAPKAFTSEYHGSQSESTGIIGILEVILSDFHRSHDQANQDEQESLTAFEQFEQETNDDVEKKTQRIEGAEGELADTKAAILDQEENLKEAKELLQSGLDSLQALETICVKGEETWEERKKARLEEIAALKEALAILEDWQA